MSSTNKTSNYELSQFLGTDKPAWLADYNSDMSKIDTQMKANADAATAASGSATSANTAIGTLANLTTDVKTDLVSAINEVDSHADTAQGTANSASSNASSALQKIGAIETALNLSVVSDLSASSSKNTISSSTVKIAKNADGSLCKVYGQLEWSNTTSFAGDVTITFSNTGLSPDTEFSVSCAGIRTIYTSGGINSTAPCTLTYKTNGTIELKFYTSAVTSNISFVIIPFVTFVKSFGDSPE